jgi:hypothetical protein
MQAMRTGALGARLAVVTLAAVALGLSLVAAAGGALKTEKASITIATGDDGSATVTCDRGTKAVAGGFDGPGFDPTFDGPYLVTFKSMRVSKREWTAVGSNFGDAVGELVSYAYCTDAVPRLKSKTKTTTIDPQENGSVSVKCPRGGEAASGGFIGEIAPDDDSGNAVYVFESRRVGKRTWKVSGFTEDDDPRTLTAIAYCAKDKLGLKSSSARTSTTLDETTLSKQAKCKKGTRVVSGGFSGTFDRPNIDLVDIFESRRAGGRKWVASTGANSLTNQVDWSVYAYCAHKRLVK